MQIDPKQMILMTRIHYHDPVDGVWGEHELDYILVMQADLDIYTNPNEIEEFYCVPKNEFNEWALLISYFYTNIVRSSNLHDFTLRY